MQQTPTIPRGNTARRGIPIWQLGLYATALSAGLNGLLYLALRRAAPGGMYGLTGDDVVRAILALSAVGALGGTFLFALLRARVRDAVAVFRVAAAVLTVLVVAAPLSLPFAPVVLGGALEAMHVVVIAVTVGVFTREIP